MVGREWAELGALIAKLLPEMRRTYDWAEEKLRLSRRQRETTGGLRVAMRQQRQVLEPLRRALNRPSIEADSHLPRGGSPLLPSGTWQQVLTSVRQIEIEANTLLSKARRATGRIAAHPAFLQMTASLEARERLFRALESMPDPPTDRDRDGLSRILGDYERLNAELRDASEAVLRAIMEALGVAGEGPRSPSGQAAPQQSEQSSHEVGEGRISYTHLRPVARYGWPWRVSVPAALLGAGAAMYLATLADPNAELGCLVAWGVTGCVLAVAAGLAVSHLVRRLRSSR